MPLNCFLLRIRLSIAEVRPILKKRNLDLGVQHPLMLISLKKRLYWHRFSQVCFYCSHCYYPKEPENQGGLTGLLRLRVGRFTPGMFTGVLIIDPKLLQITAHSHLCNPMDLWMRAAATLRLCGMYKSRPGGSCQCSWFGINNLNKLKFRMQKPSLD